MRVRSKRLAVWMAVCGFHSAALQGQEARPNILFILADDVGYEALGAYGGTSYRTPELDRLAATGTRFDHCYSMPVCHPTRICLLTGRYPSHVGRPQWGSFPQEEEGRSLGSVLKNAGYATAVAGKWQLSKLGDDLEQPHRLGFDEYCLFGWHEGPRYFQPLIWQDGKRRRDVRERYGPDVYSRFLSEFMGRNRERPFFAFYSMALCHAVSNDFPTTVPHGPLDRYETFREMVESMDERVGRLVRALDVLGLRQNTLVLFTADNGSPRSNYVLSFENRLVSENVVSLLSGVPLRGGKGRLTDSGTRVPLIASWPGTTPGGRVVGDMIDFSDFFVTFAELAGAPAPDAVALDGHSFASRLRGGLAGSRRWAYAESRDGRAFARSARWKLYSDGAFFDLARDPEEENPLASSPPEARLAREELQAALDGIAAGRN